MGKIKRDDCCCTDWRGQVKELWERWQETVRVIEVDGQRYYPDGAGLVSFETTTEVIDHDTHYTLICTITGGTQSSLTSLGDCWLLTTQYIYEMDNHYDLNESDSFTYANEGNNYLITVTG